MGDGKRFLNKKTLVMCDIAKQLLDGLPSLEINLRVVGWSNDTQMDGSTKYGSCSKYNEFPFDCGIDILWQESAADTDVLDTLIHELCHAYSHQLGYSRSPAPTIEEVRIMDEAYCRFSGFIGHNVYRNKDKITELFKKYLKVETKKK